MSTWRTFTYSICSGSKAGSCEGQKLPTEAAPVTWDKRPMILAGFLRTTACFTSERESSSWPAWETKPLWLLACGAGCFVPSLWYWSPHKFKCRKRLAAGGFSTNHLRGGCSHLEELRSCVSPCRSALPACPPAAATVC